MENNILALYYSLSSIKSHFDNLYPLIDDKLSKSQDDFSEVLFTDELMMSLKKLVDKYNPDDPLDYDQIQESNDKVQEELKFSAKNLFENQINQDDIEFQSKLHGIIEEFRDYIIQTKYMRQNAILNSIFSFENYISQLLMNTFKKYPQKIIENKSISVSQLVEFENFETAKNHLILCEVESIMYGSLDKWFKKISDLLSIKSTFYEDNKEFINEIYYRRNIMAHNSGIVNSVYIRNTNNPYDLKINEEVDNSDEYITMVTNYYLLCLAIDIHIGINFKKYDEHDETQETQMSLLSFIGFETLKKRRWKTAKYIFDRIRKIKGINDMQKSISELNYYLCAYMLGEKREMSAFKKLDYTGKSSFLKVGYFAISENYDKLTHLLNTTSSNSDPKERLGSNELSTWPIFIKLRENEPEIYEKLIKLCEDNEKSLN